MFGLGTFARVARELRHDLTAAQERDPAARDLGRAEILLTYGGVQALLAHRIAHAIHEASIERFRPIMMTTFSALMGAVPLALGFGQDASSRRPLGLVIVGGLIFSQMVTLFVTPVIYLWLEWFQEHVLDRVPFLRSAHTHHEGDVPAQPPMQPASAAVR